MNPSLSCGLLLVVLLSGCASTEETGATAMLTYAESFPSSWRINVSGISRESIDSCVADPSIADLWQSGNPPSTELSLVLIPDATEAAATKVAQCLKATLPKNVVTVMRPA